jgi:nucleotide-binding universal stress UspA family protein
MKATESRKRIRLSSVLFATDFSAAAEAAIPYASGIAKRFGSKLYVIHVRPISSGPLMVPGGDYGATEAAKVDAENRTERICAMFREAQPEVLIAEGAVWPNIADVLDEHEIDLIVLGTRGRSGIAKLLLGSVAEEIFRKARCPVLSVGPHSQPKSDPAEISKILFATDLTPQSLACPYAISLAQEYQAHLTLLYVSEPGEVVHLPYSAELLRNLVPEEAEFWCEPEFIVEPGDVAETILNVAARQQADLIVMGAHPTSGSLAVQAHLPVTTAHKVVCHAQCPVLTVRADPN